MAEISPDPPSPLGRAAPADTTTTTTTRARCAGSAATPATTITRSGTPAPAAAASSTSTRTASSSGSATATIATARKEMADLQNKEMALKKAAAKGSKAEQKAKKKQVEEEVSQLLSQLKAKHTEELASLGFKSVDSTKNNDNDSLVMAIAGVSLTTHSESKKPNKGAKRRAKRAQEEAAREQRIQEEQKNIISDRMLENEKLEKKLEPLGLMINEIKPDGHCLYRAVEDQLSLHSKHASPHSYQELREIVAKYMRERASDFLPFFLSDGNAEVDDDSSSVERFEKYCKEVESTAAWGGQLELGALTHCLKKHIVVFSGSFPDVEMGKEYKPESGNNTTNPSIRLSYHKHAYGLGEHYNSVVPTALRLDN